MHCCTGNGARAIYYFWEHMLECNNGQLRVNLLLNRASAWADVYSYVPNEGRVDLKIKRGCSSVLVRMPEWIENGNEQTACTVNGKPRRFEWHGRYVDLGNVAPGDLVMLSFPIHERTVTETIGGKQVTLILRGNTVVSVDPPGKFCPLYRRDKYRENKARLRKVERFVAEHTLDW